MVGTPLVSGVLILSEHSLAGARGIHNNPVKKFRERRCKLERIHIRHHGILHTKALDILGQDLRTGRMDLVAD